MNLKELSRHLGLSPTTVSRALNGYPEVSEATRARVMSAARTLGYHPNVRARGLATGRAMAIGHVIPVSRRNEIVNPIFGDLIAGIGEHLSTAGYDMVLSLVEDGEEAAHYRALKARGSVDGVIVSGPRTGDARIALLDGLGLPFVVHGRPLDAGAPFSWVDTNNQRAFRRAADLLLDLGHRRVALLNGPEAMDFARRRRDGFREAMEARGVPAADRPEFHAEMTEAYGYATAAALLDGPAPPTAFLVASLVPAIGVRRALEERGLALGRDVSVAIHDDELSALDNGTDVPIFTATRSSVRVAGQRLAEMLLARIAAPDAAPATHLMEAQLVLGTSTGPAPPNGTRATRTAGEARAKGP